MLRRDFETSRRFSRELTHYINRDDDEMGRVMSFLATLPDPGIPERGTPFDYGPPLFYGHSGTQYMCLFERFAFVYQFSDTKVWMKNVLLRSEYER